MDFVTEMIKKASEFCVPLFQVRKFKQAPAKTIARLFRVTVVEPPK
jgi:hypothetical protein